jgi:hypothetical protein
MAARQERLRSTTVKPKSTACCLPYFDSFVARIVTDPDSFISTHELHVEYISDVKKQTIDKVAISLAESQRRFATNLKKISTENEWMYKSSPERGYYVKLINRHLVRAVPQALNNHTRVSCPPVVIKVDNVKGSGCFASDSYMKGMTSL